MIKYILKKNIKNKFKIIYNLDGFDGDALNKEGFERNGFNRKGFDRDGYNSNKALACKEKLKQAIMDDPNTYQHATLRLKNIVDLAIFFLEQGGSFSLISKHLRKNKKVVMMAVEKNPKSFQYIGKNLKDDDDIFKLAFQQDKEFFRYASERLRKTDIQS